MSSSTDADHLAEATVSDGRLLRGLRTRRRIARHAVDVASVEGLAGLTIGRLAADLGLSKSGVQTLFKTKQQLQLATVAAAQEIFEDAVVQPTLTETRPGLPRLHALVDAWIIYAQTPLLPGGCFWTATLAEFDSRPGLVRDALREQHHRWLELLTNEVNHATAGGDLVDQNPHLTAFQIDAMLMATNIALRLDQPASVARARQAIQTVLTGDDFPRGDGRGRSRRRQSSGRRIV